MSAKRFRVLWVYQELSASKGIRTDSGQIPSLCYKGRKHMLCVSFGRPVRVLKREASDFEKLRAVPKPLELPGGGYYPVPHAVKMFREMATRCGITKGAEKILEKAELSATEDVELNEDEFTNEELVSTMDDVTKTPEGATTETVSTPKAAKAKKEKSVSKSKAKKSAPKKAVKSAAPKKAAKVIGDGLGREGTLSRFINERLMKGQDNATIAAAAAKAFPKSSSTEVKHISWSRWNLGKTKKVPEPK